MIPPAVNVTPRIRLELWALNDTIPANLDNSSCTKIFQAVLNNLDTQILTPKQYSAITNRCEEYLIKAQEHESSSALLTDEELEANDKTQYLFAKIHSKIGKLSTQKQMMQDACIAFDILQRELNTEYIVGDTTHRLSASDTVENYCTYTQTIRFNRTMETINRLDLSKGEYESLLQDTTHTHSSVLERRMQGFFSYVTQCSKRTLAPGPQ